MKHSPTPSLRDDGTFVVPRQPPPPDDAALPVDGTLATRRRPKLESARGTIRLLNVPTVGTGEHRSGWPFALTALHPLVAPDGILLDDFVERTFSYRASPVTYAEPWVGIFHHPPNMPEFSLQRHRPQEMFTTKSWQQSLPTLRMAIALTEYLAEYIRAHLAVPVAVVRHPTLVPRSDSHRRLLRGIATGD